MIDRQLFKALKNNKCKLCLIVLFMLGAFICHIAFIFLLIEGMLTRKVAYFSMGLILVCSFLCAKYANKFKGELGNSMKLLFREEIFKQSMALGLKNPNQTNLSQIAVEGVEQLELYYSIYLPQFFYALLTPIILFTITAFFSLKVSLVLIICVPLIPLSIMMVSRYAKKVFSTYWQQYLEMGHSFIDLVSGMKELILFSQDENSQQKMNEENELFRKVTMKVLVMQLCSTTIMDLVAYGGAGLGIALAIQEGLTTFNGLFLVLVAVEFFLPLRAFGSAFHIAMNGLSAGTRILAYLKLSKEEWKNEKDFKQVLTIDHLHFAYDQQEVLKDIHLSLEGNGLYCLVGQSGCGKSTLANLILGIYQPTRGKVFFGQHEIQDYERDTFYEHVTYVDSSPYLFKGKIKDQFLLSNDQATLAMMQTALKAVKLDDVLNLEDEILENGANLSGGQKTRLALAFLLTKPKSVYIFDEITSQIDYESKLVILDIMKQLSKDHLVILITHRYDDCAISDGIFYMEEGMIKERGLMAELLLKDGGFKVLYETQKEMEGVLLHG